MINATIKRAMTTWNGARSGIAAMTCSLADEIETATVST